MVEFDLFKLHDNKLDNTPRKWIMASGSNLKGELSKVIGQTKLTRYQLFKKVQKKLKISSANAQRLVYLKRKWYPLIFIKHLLDITDNSKSYFQKHIDFLKPNQPPEKISKAVKKLNIELCKIAGAHAADGTLYENFFCISDRNLSNIEAFKKWVKRCFETDLAPIIKKGDNEWCLRFHNKIICRYLTKILGFPSGKKQYTVGEPDIIRNSSLRFRKAFALGALTFEAGFGIKRQVEFCVSSKKFRDCLYEIISAHKMRITLMKNHSNGYWRFWSNILSNKDKKKWLNFFEPYTEKWYKLFEDFNGFQGKIMKLEDAIMILDIIFPKQSSSKTTLREVFKIIRKQKETWRYKIEYEITGMKSKWAHSIKHYIDILRMANIIRTEKKSFGKKKSFGNIIRDVYIYNPEVYSWTVPYRPWLENDVKYTNLEEIKQSFLH